jgi:hypothetical protein
MSELDPNRTPGTVIGAVAGGTVVVPFLIIYAVLLIARGTFVDIATPDVTSSRTGEAVVGVAALLILAVVLAGMGRLLNGRGRWLFVASQGGCAAIAVVLLLDSSSGEPQVPAVVLVGSLAAIALALVPTSWAWVAGNGGAEPLSTVDPLSKSDEPGRH